MLCDVRFRLFAVGPNHDNTQYRFPYDALTNLPSCPWKFEVEYHICVNHSLTHVAHYKDIMGLSLDVYESMVRSWVKGQEFGALLLLTLLKRAFPAQGFTLEQCKGIVKNFPHAG